MKVRLLGIIMLPLVLVSAVMLSVQQQHFIMNVSDALLTAQLKSAFFLHPQTKSRNIHVAISQGKVILSGVVNTQQEIKLAEFITRTTPGVASVNAKYLKVKNC